MVKKPRETNEKASSTATMINIALVVGALVLTSGILWYTLKSPAPDTRAALPKPNVVTLDPEQFTGQARLAYEAAREVPEVLAQLPCYCGCMSSIGHRNNLDCFHDHHGVECAICQGIAIDARDLYKKGWDIERIREKIKNTYSKSAALMN